MRCALLTALVAACGAPRPVAQDAVLGVSVDAALQAGDRGSRLVVRVSAPADATWNLPDPPSEGLTLTAQEGREERVGDRVVTTRSWSVKGPPGSYVIEALCVDVDDSPDPPACTYPLYLDIGVQPDRSAMADIIEPAPTWPEPPWIWVVAALVGAAGLAGAGRSLLKRAPEPVIDAVPEEPPDVVAIRRWEAIRDDPSLSDFEKALGLSEVFRAYVEDVLRFPARSWTTTQTLSHLERLDALPRVNLPRARRLLRATDRVKYAEARPSEHFFQDLEADLHGFIDQTRPRSWTPEEQGS